ncbi:MAG: peptidase U32 family protein, partial [Planctomycetota bacterium]
KNPELLSPAGDVESFFAAAENGADAVYLGLDCFSARANAHNFTLDGASMAIAHARKRSVKVYVALNTLIKAAEMERVAEYLVALEELQPDALIIQDLGVLRLIQSRPFPFRLHASTQMAIHNLAGVKQLEKMGFKRVVLARELSLQEIRHITQNTPLEIEVFVHGALCYSYSGLCFFSSMLGGRSGNRGQCAQPCRMRYTHQSGKEGYLFSMKDLLALPHTDALMDAGVRSFKIEGRMKSPEYVAVATHVYRQAIDGKLEDYDEAARLLKTVFSRETTHSYLKSNVARQDHETATGGSRKPADTVNLAYPANTGCCVGEIVRSERGFVAVRADAEIGVRDLLQVFEKSFASPALLPVKNVKVNGKRVFGIKAGDTATVESHQQFQPGSRLHLLYSQKTRESFTPKIPKKQERAKLPVSLE